jgi:hypothetical protein
MRPLEELKVSPRHPQPQDVESTPAREVHPCYPKVATPRQLDDSSSPIGSLDVPRKALPAAK